MTQIASALSQARPGIDQSGAERRAQARRRYFTGTPGRMRLVAVLASTACLAFALAGFFGLRGVEDSVDRASANTEQVVRVRAIYTDLLAADAAVTNGFLKGGQESATNRQTYDDAMARVASEMARAAAAQRADGTALAALNEEVQAYASNVDRARTYNREGKPVGAQYLRIAGTELRATALPIASAVAEANEQRAGQELSVGTLGGLIIGVGALALGLLAAFAAWLARRTHRYLNLPLAAATALIAGALGLSVSHIVTVGTTMADVDRGDYSAAVSLARARAAAYDAKANESLGLIARGNGATYASAYEKSVTDAGDRLGEVRAADPQQARLTTLFGEYTTTHGAIRSADDSGDWNAAVDLATATKAGSANTTFTAFDDAASTVLATKVESITDAFDRVEQWYLPLLVGAMATLAAVLAGRSMTKRIEEYR